MTVPTRTFGRWYAFSLSAAFAVTPPIGSGIVPTGTTHHRRGRCDYASRDDARYGVRHRMAGSSQPHNEPWPMCPRAAAGAETQGV